MNAAATPMAKLASALRVSGLTVELETIEMEPGVAIEQVKLLLLTDYAGRDVVVQMLFVTDGSETITDPGGDAEDALDSGAILLFSAILPFRALPEAFLDTMRIVLAINRLVPIGGFGFSETDGGIVLAYQHAMHERSALTGLVLEEIINALAFAIDTYAPLIERVASGEADFDALVAAMQETGVGLAPVGEPLTMRTRRH